MIMYVHVIVCVCVRVYTCMCLYMHSHMRVCMYMCMNNMCVHTHTCAHTYTSICVHVHPNLHTCVPCMCFWCTRSDVYLSKCIYIHAWFCAFVFMSLSWKLLHAV